MQSQNATESITLAEALPLEQARVRELVKVYDEIPTGVFGAMVLRQVLSRAEQAIAAHDTVAMLRSYEQLRNCK